MIKIIYRLSPFHFNFVSVVIDYPFNLLNKKELIAIIK